MFTMVVTMATESSPHLNSLIIGPLASSPAMIIIPTGRNVGPSPITTIIIITIILIVTPIMNNFNNYSCADTEDGINHNINNNNYTNTTTGSKADAVT